MPLRRTAAQYRARPTLPIWNLGTKGYSVACFFRLEQSVIDDQASGGYGYANARLLWCMGQVPPYPRGGYISFGGSHNDLRWVSVGEDGTPVNCPAYGLGLQADTWYHVLAQVHADGKRELYLDGALVATVMGSKPLEGSPGPLVLGARERWGSQAFVGSLKQVGSWSKVLAQSQIDKLIANGMNPPLQAGNVLWLELDRDDLAPLEAAHLGAGWILEDFADSIDYAWHP